MRKPQNNQKSIHTVHFTGFMNRDSFATAQLDAHVRIYWSQCLTCVMTDHYHTNWLLNQHIGRNDSNGEKNKQTFSSVLNCMVFCVFFQNLHKMDKKINEFIYVLESSISMAVRKRSKYEVNQNYVLIKWKNKNITQLHTSVSQMSLSL